MAVTSFDEIHNGRDSDDEASRKSSVRRYTRVWRAVTDSNSDDGSVVLASAPARGAVHNKDPNAYCRRRRARNESFSKTVWIVTCAYSTEFEMLENPLSDPAEITWNTEQFQEPAVKDRNGKGILNSAGDPFDPPAEKDDSRWTVIVRKNVAKIPSWLRGYKDGVNIAAFELDGESIGVEEAKMQAISIGKWEERNDIKFRVLTMTIHLKEEGKKWDLSLLDQGFRQIGDTGSGTGEGTGTGTGCGRENIVNSGDGEEPTAPVLLDGAGRAQECPTTNTAVYLNFEVYNLKDFSVLPLT